jgi:hypothetical protein
MKPRLFGRESETTCKSPGNYPERLPEANRAATYHLCLPLSPNTSATILRQNSDKGIPDAQVLESASSYELALWRQAEGDIARYGDFATLRRRLFVICEARKRVRWSSDM